LYLQACNPCTVEYCNPRNLVRVYGVQPVQVMCDYCSANMDSWATTDESSASPATIIAPDLSSDDDVEDEFSPMAIWSPSTP